MDANEVVRGARERARELSESTAALAAVGGILGGGVGLLLALSARSLRGRPAEEVAHVRGEAADAVDAIAAKAEEARAAAAAEAESARERVKAAADAAAEAAARATSAASSAADGAFGRARGAAAALEERASTTAHAAGEMLRGAASVARERLEPELHALTSEPVLVAIGAFAVGAAAAALVPLTHVEEELGRPVKRRVLELVRAAVLDVGERIDARIAAVGEALGGAPQGEPGGGTEPSIH